MGHGTLSPKDCLERGLGRQKEKVDVLGAPAWREPRTCVLLWMGMAVLGAAESTQCSVLLVPKGSRGLVTSHEEHCSLTLRVFLALNQVPQVQAIPNT